MKQTMTWILMLGAGAAMVMAGVMGGPGIGGFFDVSITMMMATMGCVLTIFPTINIIGQAKKAKILPFIAGLKDDEQVTLFTDIRNRINPIVVNTKHEGILHKRGMGIVEDKGTPLTWADTGIPVSISLQKCGITVDLKKAQYTSELEKQGILDYEEAIRRYLGPASYATFKVKFRETSEPQYEEIEKELCHLLGQTPNDPLAAKICGETVNFKNFLSWLRYAYHPLSAENAVDSEILETKRENLLNKEGGKVQNWGKLIIMVLIGLGIFVVILATMGPQLGLGG